MVNAKLLIICFLILLATTTISLAQECAINLKTEVKNASIGSSDGRITFKLESGGEIADKYLIFEITAVADVNSKRVKVENGEIDHLSAGRHEFLVIDKKNPRCFNEILVQVKEQ